MALEVGALGHEHSLLSESRAHPGMATRSSQLQQGTPVAATACSPATGPYPAPIGHEQHDRRPPLGDSWRPRVVTGRTPSRRPFLRSVLLKFRDSQWPLLSMPGDVQFSMKSSSSDVMVCVTAGQRKRSTSSRNRGCPQDEGATVAGCTLSFDSTCDCRDCKATAVIYVPRNMCTYLPHEGLRAKKQVRRRTVLFYLDPHAECSRDPRRQSISQQRNSALPSAQPQWFPPQKCNFLARAVFPAKLLLSCSRFLPDFLVRDLWQA